MGRLKDAEHMRALEASNRTLGAEHPDTLTCIKNLAFCLHKMGQMKDAEPLYWRALGGRARTLGEHPATSACANNLATCLKAMGDLKAAASQGICGWEQAHQRCRAFNYIAICQQCRGTSDWVPRRRPVGRRRAAFSRVFWCQGPLMLDILTHWKRSTISRLPKRCASWSGAEHPARHCHGCLNMFKRRQSPTDAEWRSDYVAMHRLGVLSSSLQDQKLILQFDTISLLFRTWKWKDCCPLSFDQRSVGHLGSFASRTWRAWNFVQSHHSSFAAWPDPGLGARLSHSSCRSWISSVRTGQELFSPRVKTTGGCDKLGSYVNITSQLLVHVRWYPIWIHLIFRVLFVFCAYIVSKRAGMTKETIWSLHSNCLWRLVLTYESGLLVLLSNSTYPYAFLPLSVKFPICMHLSVADIW